MMGSRATVTRATVPIVSKASFSTCSLPLISHFSAQLPNFNNNCCYWPIGGFIMMTAEAR